MQIMAKILNLKISYKNTKKKVKNVNLRLFKNSYCNAYNNGTNREQ